MRRLYRRLPGRSRQHGLGAAGPVACRRCEQRGNDVITLTIDGRQAQVPEGATVLDAARSIDLYIPTLCDHPRLEPYGGCRMCIVEIDGVRGLPTACTTPATDGMIVRTDTGEVNSVRRMICQMLIADHPADCLVCTSNQRCRLQEVAS